MVWCTGSKISRRSRADQATVIVHWTRGGLRVPASASGSAGARERHVPSRVETLYPSHRPP